MRRVAYSRNSASKYDYLEEGDQVILELKLDVRRDNRMYLPVSIYSKLYYGLLDCGATASVIGKKGWKKLERLGVPLLPSHIYAVKVANGKQCRVLGVVEIPLEVENQVRLCTFLVVPDMVQEVILGMDLWRLFGMVPNVVTGTCELWNLPEFDVAELVVSEKDFVYLDDIILISKDFDHHMRLLESVLSRLEAAGLTVNLSKCHFCRSELKYLGYVVNENGLQVDPEKVRAIAEFRRPHDPRSIKRFAGMASWYRRFIMNFATIMAPLHRLTAKNMKFRWTEECELAFVTIKERLTTAPVVTWPDFSKPFDVHRDASSYGLGAILSRTLAGVYPKPRGNTLQRSKSVWR